MVSNKICSEQHTPSHYDTRSLLSLSAISGPLYNYAMAPSYRHGDTPSASTSEKAHLISECNRLVGESVRELEGPYLEKMKGGGLPFSCFGLIQAT